MKENEMDGHELEEKYQRPCFAVCKHCGTIGYVVFTDGSLSKTIVSIEDGNSVIDTLRTTGQLSERDADRVFSQLICSNLPNTNKQALGLAKATLMVAIGVVMLKPTEEDDWRRWN